MAIQQNASGSCRSRRAGGKYAPDSASRQILKIISLGMRGVCIDCGNRIPGAASQAGPVAVRCLPCHREFERRSTRR